MTKKKDSPRPKRLDLFDKWVEAGILQEKLEAIKKDKRDLWPEKDIAYNLGIRPETFIRLKKKHPEIQEALDTATRVARHDVLSAVYKQVMGYDVIERTTIIDDNGNQKPKRKVSETRRHIPGNFYAAEYLLTKMFGKEFAKDYEMTVLKASLAQENTTTDDEVETTVIIDDIK